MCISIALYGWSYKLLLISRCSTVKDSIHKRSELSVTKISHGNCTLFAYLSWSHINTCRAPMRRESPREQQTLHTKEKLFTILRRGGRLASSIAAIPLSFKFMIHRGIYAARHNGRHNYSGISTNLRKNCFEREKATNCQFPGGNKSR